MPRLNQFSAWVQHGSDRLEEHGVQYTPDQRVVTCWIADGHDPRQDLKHVCWKSNGLGHPSRIRLSTERAKVNTCHPPPYSERAPFMPLLLVRNGDYESERKPQPVECKECAEVAAVLDGKICTIKVEVFFSSIPAGSENASGSLPLTENEASKNGGKKVGSVQHAVLVPPVLPPIREAAHHSNGSTAPPISPSTLPSISTVMAEPYVTFYFRCRPREVLMKHGIIRSRSHPLRKRSRSPSPCAYGFEPEHSHKRSRSAPSELGTDDTLRIGSPVIPYYECSKSIAMPQPGYPSRRGPDGMPTSGRIVGSSSSSVAEDEPTLVGGVQSVKERGENVESESDSDDELFFKLEQRLLEAHQMLLKLKMKHHRRKRTRPQTLWRSEN